MEPVSFNNRDVYSTWIFNCNINTKSNKIEKFKNNTEELLIKGPNIASIVEYEEESMIISIEPANLLLIKEWKKVRVVEDTNQGNTGKHWINPIPGFCKNFPFLVCSGSQTFNLINVDTGKMEPLI